MFRQASHFKDKASSVVSTSSPVAANDAAAIPSATHQVKDSFFKKQRKIKNVVLSDFFLWDVHAILIGGEDNQNTLLALYGLDVFKRDKQRQNPANVAQYTLMQLTQLTTAIELSFYRDLFNLLWDVVEHNILDIVLRRENGARYLSTIIYNLGQLARSNPDWLKSRISPGILSFLVRSLLTLEPSSRDIANAISGLGSLAKADLSVLFGEISSADIDGLVLMFQEKESTIQEAINLAFSTVHLPVSATSQFSLFKLLQIRKQQGELSCLKEAIVWRQLHQFCGAVIAETMKLESYGQSGHEILAVRSFFEETQAEGADEVPKSSDAHKKYCRQLKLQLARDLKDCGVEITIKSEVYCYGYFIDIAIMKNGAPWVVVEVNGPQHYCADGRLKHQYHVREEIVRSAAGYEQVWNYSVSQRAITADIKSLVSMLKSKLMKDHHEDCLSNAKAVFSFEHGVLHHRFFSQADALSKAGSKPVLECDFTITFN